MTDQLALRYRPRSFDDLVGQRAVNVVLRHMVNTNQVPTALMFHGCHGTGKTTTARILAAALNCHTPPGPCNSCVSCKSVFDGGSMDVIEIDAASNGLVDNIRDLRQQVMFSVGGEWRVVILDEAHSMSVAAFNALLKTLEEPPPRTVFVLCTTEPHKILDTVASRCMGFRFARIPVADMADRLAHIADTEHIVIDPALLTLIADRADGAMRDAVMSLDQLARVGIATIADYQALVGDTDIGPAIVAAIIRGDIAAALAATADAYRHIGDADTVAHAIAGTFRDLLVLHAGGQLTMQGSAADRRAQLADACDPATVRGALAVVWDLTVHTRVTDRRLALDLAVAVMCDKVAPPPAPAAPQPARKLSLAEIAAFR